MENFLQGNDPFLKNRTNFRKTQFFLPGGGLIPIGGGIATPPGPPGGIPPGSFPALNAAVVASIKL